MDLVFGDPERLPHPIVWFGKMIAFGEKRLNRPSQAERGLDGGGVDCFGVWHQLAIAMVADGIK